MVGTGDPWRQGTYALAVYGLVPLLSIGCRNRISALLILEESKPEASTETASGHKSFYHPILRDFTRL
jgi:hypothetical protein